MSYCITCPNKDKEKGCTYSGKCIIKEYNLDPEYIPEFIASAKQIVTKEEEQVKAEEAKESKGNEVVFNPFQRGNGCTLAGYTLQEILAHTR